MIEVILVMTIFVVMSCTVCMALAKAIYGLSVDIAKLLKKLLEK